MSDLLKSYGTKNVGTAPVSVYSTPAGKTAVAIGANIANILDVTINVTIQLNKAGNLYTILRKVYIPPNCAYIWSGADQKIILDPTDSFIVTSDVAASCDVIVSVSEIV